MGPGTRRVLDRSFTGLGVFSIVLVSLALVVLLAPIVVRGVRAFVFRGTIEHRRLLCERFGRGDRAALVQEVTQFASARNAIYDRIDQFARSLRGPDRKKYAGDLKELRENLLVLLGPPRSLESHLRAPGLADPSGPPPTQDPNLPALARDQYGQTRWDRALVKLHHVLYRETWEQPAGDGATPQALRKVDRPRADDFRGTPLEPLFAELSQNLASLLQARWTFYWGFLTDESIDAHLFGGVWPEILGTLYLTLGAILFAVPLGIISAIYLVEYAPESWAVSILRSCISTLAGVPSIVFGLFGLAFFINAIHVSPSKSVLAGSLTLAVLILPMIIRASEEALRAVPLTYKEAALSVGAGRWRTIITVILPAALPGILTGVVLSMGRAAGETAPIIFTAAVSVGRPLQLWQTLTQGTPALPWNVYNLATEHAAADEIRHVQYGMVLTLVTLVLMLNVTAIVMRARIARRLTG